MESASLRLVSGSEGIRIHVQIWPYLFQPAFLYGMDFQQVIYLFIRAMLIAVSHNYLGKLPGYIRMGFKLGFGAFIN
jgi:hypothetical protein